MNNELEVKATSTLKVYDAENKDWIEISPKEQIIASKIHNKILEGAYYSAILITKMIEERHYLALGCESRDEYINTMTPYSRSQAYILLAIGRKFAGFLGGNIENQLMLEANNPESPDSGLRDKTSDSAESALLELGITKLYELTKLDDSEIKDLMTNGKTTISGYDFTIEDIKEQSAKEIQKRVSENKKLYTGKIAQMQEEIKTLKEEKKILETDGEKIKTAVELEKLYGGVASKLEDKKTRLNEAYSLLNDFIETLVRCGITPEDPQVLQQQAVDIIRQIDSVNTRAMTVLGDVIASAG